MRTVVVSVVFMLILRTAAHGSEALLFTKPSEGVGLWQVDVDGTGARELLDGEAHFQSIGDPAVSPAGDRLAFAAEQDGISRIYVTGLDAEDLVEITTGREPAWSPDGTSLVFSQILSESSEDLSIIDLASGSVRTVTPFPIGSARHPDWSPDGVYIAYASNRDRDKQSEIGTDIWCVNLEDGSHANLTKTSNFSNDSPSWSPDGSRIAYASRGSREDSWQLWALDFITRDVRTLHQRSSLREPSWSPSGRLIAAVETSGKPSTLVILDLATGEFLDMEVTAGRTPAWGRSLPTAILPLTWGRAKAAFSAVQ